MKNRPFFLVFAGILAFAPLAGAAVPPPQVPATPLLAPDSDISQSPFYKAVLKSKGEKALERAKIRYLISRVRASSYEFIRNGVAYRGPRASQHLAWKYSFVSDQIKTADQFIVNIAAESSVTQKPYLLKTKDGETYPFRDVLFNELQALEEHLKHERPPAL